VRLHINQHNTCSDLAHTTSRFAQLVTSLKDGNKKTKRKPIFGELFCFVCLVEIEKRLDVGSVAKSPVALHLLKLFGLVVAPAALAEKGVEDKDFLLIRPPAIGKTPFQKLFIGSARQRSLGYGWIFDIQESADSSVRAGAVLIIRGQLSPGMQPNLIQHPSKENEAANLLG